MVQIGQKKYSEVKVSLGDIHFSIVSANCHLIEELKNCLITLPGGNEPDFIFKIGYAKYLDKYVSELSSSHTSSNIDDWKKIGFKDEGIKGYFKWSDNQVELVFEKTVTPISPHHLFSLIVSAFYVLKNKGDSNLEDNIFLHAAGMIRNSKGYIFTGPSGSGKTTVSRLSCDDAIVVNDEFVELRQIKTMYYLSKTPLKREFCSTESPPTEVSAIFFLKKAKQHSFHRIRGAEAAFKLVEGLVHPASFCSSPIENIEERLNLVCNLANKVPCYEMRFSKDCGFWKDIRRLGI